MKRTLALATLVVLLLPVALAAKDSRDSRDSGNSLVRFEGGIGVDPVSNVAGDPVILVINGVNTTTFPNVIRNVVRGVNPPGQIWRIAALTADVKIDGRIRVQGRGLLLAGGNTIGTNGNQSVRARLFCDNTTTPTRFDSANLVALEPNGDFRIVYVLRSTSGATPPNPCSSPVLLIINGGGAWFAAGIPDLDDND